MTFQDSGIEGKAKESLEKLNTLFKSAPWESLAGAAGFGMLGVLAYYAHTLFSKGGAKRLHRLRVRAREDAAYTRRICKPWKNSHDHMREMLKRLSYLMRKAKRKDRELYVLYRDLRKAGKAGDNEAYAVARERYQRFWENKRRGPL